jgi:hypothetical protein
VFRENHYAEPDPDLHDWLEAAAYGIVRNELDGWDVLPLYGMLPLMEPGLEALVDRLLIREVVGWKPPVIRAIERRRFPAAVRLDARQVDRVRVSPT